jgi:hypothetical protein
MTIGGFPKGVFDFAPAAAKAAIGYIGVIDR